MSYGMSGMATVAISHRFNPMRLSNPVVKYKKLSISQRLATTLCLHQPHNKPYEFEWSTIFPINKPQVNGVRVTRVHLYPERMRMQMEYIKQEQRRFMKLPLEIRHATHNTFRSFIQRFIQRFIQHPIKTTTRKQSL